MEIKERPWPPADGSELDLAPTPKADRVLPARERCTFSRSPEADPVFWIAREGATVATKPNGILMVLEPADDTETAGIEFSALRTTVTVRRLGDEADWRQNADLVFELDEGLSVGDRGFRGCES